MLDLAPAPAAKQVFSDTGCVWLQTTYAQANACTETYLTLWCWVFDEGFLEIRNPKEFAFESGFSGPRAEATWKNRMLRLESLGFIKAKEGLSGPFHNVVLLDPVRVIQKIYEARPHDLHYGVFFSRLTQIGANDVAVEENEG